MVNWTGKVQRCWTDDAGGPRLYCTGCTNSVGVRSRSEPPLYAQLSLSCLLDGPVDDPHLLLGQGPLHVAVSDSVAVADLLRPAWPGGGGIGGGDSQESPAEYSGIRQGAQRNPEIAVNIPHSCC